LSLCRSQFDAYAEVFGRNFVSDGAGGKTQGWTSRGNIYALIQESPANESLDKEGLKTNRGVAFITDYWSAITVKDRIQLDGNTFHVTSLTRIDKNDKPHYRGEFLKILTDKSVWYSV
jgi:SPP1 family predicted phage head-tail adaptor